MLIVRFTILFRVTSWICLHVLLIKKHKRSLFTPVSINTPLLNTQSALIGQLTHTIASTANNSRAAVLNRFLHGKLTLRHMLRKMCDTVTQCDVTMSQCHRIKRGRYWRGVSGTVFSVGERSFCWCGLTKHWRKGKKWKKQNRSPFGTTPNDIWFPWIRYSPNVRRVSMATWRSSSSAESHSAMTALMLSTACTRRKAQFRMIFCYTNPQLALHLK